MKKSKLRPPRRIKINGQTYWQVWSPGPGGIGGSRRAFRLKEDAEIFHARAKTQIARFGTAAMELTDRLRVQAIEGSKKLEPYGATLAEAVEFYVKHLKARQGGVPLKQVVKELVAARTTEGKSQRYVQDLRLRLGRFAQTFPDKTSREIATADVDAFLSGLGLAPGTANTFRRDLRTLFEFARGRGYAEENPVERAGKFATKDHKIEILTVTQTARLLASCEPSIVPAVALAVFCGLRQAEIERLQWPAVDLSERIVTVDATIAKTGSRRIVDIPPAAVEWITPHASREGAVMPADFRRLFDRARVRAGFRPSFVGRDDAALQELLKAAAAKARRAKGAQKKAAKLLPWPANCLRHGAISYRLAQSGDITRTATTAGNSPAVIAKHYLQLVKPSAAEAFFSIRPAGAGKITNINAA